MAKLHLAESPTRLSEGRDIDALCGATVKNAAFVPFAEESDMTVWQNICSNPRVCRKCVDKGWTLTYLYQIIERKHEHQSTETITDQEES